MYLCDYCLSFCLTLLNILLYFKHFEFVDDEESVIIVEGMIETICNTMMIITAFALIRPFFTIF